MPKLVFLGTGPAVPSSADLRHDSATWLSYGKHCNILVDCGEGVKYNLLRAGVSERVHHIFLTHDHFDLIMGLTGLLAMMSLKAQETSALDIYGPSPAIERAQILVGLVRSQQGMSLSLRIEYHSLEADHELSLGMVEAKAFATAHREKPSLGYVFVQSGGRNHKVVFTGDTRYLSTFVEVARGGDWLIANTNFAEDRSEHANEYGHMTVIQAAMLARDANVDRLFLQHLSPRYAKELRGVLAEARRVFPETYLAEDLLAPPGIRESSTEMQEEQDSEANRGLGLA